MDPKDPFKKCVLVVDQPQAGKTGISGFLLNLLVDYFKTNNLTFQAVYISALPHLNVNEQNTKRLCTGTTEDGRKNGYDLDAKIRNTNLAYYKESEQNRLGLLTFNNSQKLNNLDLEVPGTRIDVRVIFIDEIHIGNVKEGVIDKMLKRHGIFINEQTHVWEDRGTINIVVGISATPSAHLIVSDRVEADSYNNLFEVVNKPPQDNYNSIGDMLRKGRLRLTEKCFTTTGEPTSFLKECLNNFKEDCLKYGPGYLVYRANGKNHMNMKKLINSKNISYKEFDCNEKNLKDLNMYLGKKPIFPMIILIKGSMRAGMTLPHNNYIRGWVETESKNADTPVQSGVGRACGYDREKDIYPIYCSLDGIRAWVEAYEDLTPSKDNPKGYIETIPKGSKNKVHTTKMNKHSTRSFDVSLIDKAEAYKLQKGCKKFQWSTTAGSVCNDIARFIMEKKGDSSHTLGYYINGPTPKKAFIKYINSRKKKDPNYNEAEAWLKYERHQESYKELRKMYPDCEGKYARLFEKTDVTQAPAIDKKPGLVKTAHYLNLLV